MTDENLMVYEENLSLAWRQAFLKIMEAGTKEITPLVVTISGLENGPLKELQKIRDELDQELADKGKQTCETVANTIFPQSLWNPNMGREQLFTRYLTILPKIRQCKGNSYGVYFERLVTFGTKRVNQLEHIITTFKKGNHRGSALQAAVFDPERDHSDQRQRGFPCLQQVAFLKQDKKGLNISGYYPRQTLFDRAYGNYLGLCRLGYFMACEMGLILTKMTCFVGVAALGENRQELKNLEKKIKNIL